MMDLANAYLDRRGLEGLNPKSIAIYRHHLEELIKFLQEGCHCGVWANVTPAYLTQYMLFLLIDRRLKKNTRMKRAFQTECFFRWLAEEGRIITNPARDLPLPDGGEEDLPVPPLEEAKVIDLMESLPRRNVVDLRNRLHLELLYSCGLRMAESTGLNLKDIDLSRQLLRITPLKGGRGRTLPLMKGVLGALKDYLALRRSLLRGPDHGALLLSRLGERLNEATFRLYLRNLNRKRGGAARRIHPHLLRHSIAVHLLRGGADLRHIQEFLGHANLDTTKVYLRLVPGRLKEDYDEAMPQIAVEM